MTTATTTEVPTSEFTIMWLLQGPQIHRAEPLDRTSQAEIARFIGQGECNVHRSWLEHETWLRAEAAKRDIKPAWSGGRFYGETVSLGARPDIAKRLTAPIEKVDTRALKATAYHEAAHAVIGVVLGIPITRAVALPGGGFVNWAWPDAPTDDRDPQAVVAMPFAAYKEWTLPAQWPLACFAVAVAAGSVAQKRVVSRNYADSGWGDVAQLQGLLARAMGQPGYTDLIEDLIAVFTRYAEHYVALHWEWIRAVANALLEHKQLNGAEILALRPATLAPLSCEPRKGTS